MNVIPKETTPLKHNFELEHFSFGFVTISYTTFTTQLVQTIPYTPFKIVKKELEFSEKEELDFRGIIPDKHQNLASQSGHFNLNGITWDFNVLSTGKVFLHQGEKKKVSFNADSNSVQFSAVDINHDLMKDLQVTYKIEGVEQVKRFTFNPYNFNY